MNYPAKVPPKGKPKHTWKYTHAQDKNLIYLSPPGALKKCIPLEIQPQLNLVL